MSEPKDNIRVLLDTIIEKVPHPQADVDKPLSMLVSQTESNSYFGKMLIGRINTGRVSIGDRVQSIDLNGNILEHTKIHKIIRRFGVHQIELQTAVAGDIVSVSGFEKTTVTHTINAAGNTVVIPVSIFIIYLVNTNRSANDINDSEA
jgi:GTP-binding protein